MRIRVAALAAAFLACNTPPPEQASWQVVENGRLALYGQLPEPEAGAALLGLERFRAAVEAAVGIRPPREPRLRVVLFSGARAAGGILDGRWAAGFAASLADGDVVVSAHGRPGLERLYVEAILSGRAPYWYAQGMADLLSTLRIDGENVTIGLPPRGYAKTRPRSEEVDEDGKKTPITGSTLLADERFKPGVEKRRPDHWLLTHYLLLASRERAEGLREYLRLWQLGVPSEQAFERAIGRPADALYREELARYAERGTKARTLPLAGFAPDPELRARPADGAELRDLLAQLRAWQARHEAPRAR